MSPDLVSVQGMGYVVKRESVEVHHRLPTALQSSRSVLLGGPVNVSERWGGREEVCRRPGQFLAVEEVLRSLAEARR